MGKDTSRPSIDHGILSPSGRISKRARVAALERTRVELFGEAGLNCPVPVERTLEERAVALRECAKQLRDLAARGMCPRAHEREAKKLEAEAERLLAERG